MNIDFHETSEFEIFCSKVLAEIFLNIFDKYLPLNLKSKNAKIYGRTNDQAPSFAFWYLGNHSMEYTDEFYLTVSCHFHFESYPFDVHNCDITVGFFNARKCLIENVILHAHLW